MAMVLESMQAVSSAKANGHMSGSSLGGGEQPVIHVNFRLSWRQIAVILGTLVTSLGGLATAGWIAMPAKQSDLTKVEQGLAHLQQEVSGLRDATKEIVYVVKELRTQIMERPTPPPPPPPRPVRRSPVKPPAVVEERKPESKGFISLFD